MKIEDHRRDKTKLVVISLLKNGQVKVIASTLTKMENGLIYAGKIDSLELLALEDEEVLRSPNVGAVSCYLAKLLVKHDTPEISSMTSKLVSAAERKDNNLKVAEYLVNTYMDSNQPIEF